MGHGRSHIAYSGLIRKKKKTLYVNRQTCENCWESVEGNDFLPDQGTRSANKNSHVMSRDPQRVTKTSATK